MQNMKEITLLTSFFFKLLSVSAYVNLSLAAHVQLWKIQMYT